MGENDEPAGVPTSTVFFPEARSEFDVALVAYDVKIRAVKAVRQVTGLVESLRLVESVPVVVVGGIALDDAAAAARVLEAAGGKVEIR